jgi:hypothetical protein
VKPTEKLENGEITLKGLNRLAILIYLTLLGLFHYPDYSVGGMPPSLPTAIQIKVLRTYISVKH